MRLKEAGNQDRNLRLEIKKQNKIKAVNKKPAANNNKASGEKGRARGEIE
jgi:hypothetical protein